MSDTTYHIIYVQEPSVPLISIFYQYRSRYLSVADLSVLVGRNGW